MQRLLARIARLEAENEQLRDELNHDELTGLKNRRALQEYDGEGWYVYGDLDGFKEAQDAHPNGHDFGDEILREFALFLRTETRNTDLVAFRHGGDEFAVWAPSQESAKAIRDRVRKWSSRHDSGVTCSAGIGSPLEAADAAMFIDKQRKKKVIEKIPAQR